MLLAHHVMSLVGAQSQTVPPGSLTEKILLLFGGALVGFLSTFVLDRIKARREPTRRLSWDASVRRAALVDVIEDIKYKVRFLYEGTQVTDLTHIRCTITNTGNQLLKGQELRFPFPEEVTVLKPYLDPVPEQELGVARIEDSAEGHVRYRIGHLEQNAAVVFNFVTAGGELSDWRPHSLNPDGVDFQRRDVTGLKQDQHHLFPFFMILLLIQTLPAALNLFVLGYIGDAAASVIRIGLLVALLPHVRPLVRIVERLVTRAKEPSVRANHLIQGDIRGNVLMARNIEGDIAFAEDDEEHNDVHVNTILGNGSKTPGDH